MTRLSRDDLGRRADPVRLLQSLIRFDTTNPPGHEAACVAYIHDLLTAAGCSPIVLARDPDRPNLIARVTGQGHAPPLLLYGHVDVVTTAGQQWQYPPFEGRLADGCVWGRGALDMKGGIAMMLSAVLRMRADGLVPRGDVVLTILSDEEALGDAGARFLVEEHPGLLAGVRYAIGEFGGFALHLDGRKFYPLQVAEKQICWMRAVLRGPGGHGSLPARGGAMARLARMLQALDRRRMPVHVTPVARQMIAAIAAALPFPTGSLLAQLLRPRMTDRILDALGPRGKPFDPLLHHTVNATIVHGGEKINVIPSVITVELDGRVLPGYGPADMLAELRGIFGRTVELDVTRFDPGPGEPDLTLLPLLADILREADPQAIPVPMLLPGVTDGRYLARLGIQTYGFIPMDVPEGFSVSAQVHAPDERIPISALYFGTEAISRLLQRLGSA